MSFQGMGTQSNPYIVSDYEDIKYLLEQLRAASESAETMYLNLANDIDCNKYGPAFEWSISATSQHKQPFILDLQGHTIKNVMIAKGGALFGQGLNSTASMTDVKRYLVKNGNLLNIFNNSASDLAHAIRFENVSISADVTNMTNYGCVSSCSFSGCSVYIKNSTSASTNTIFTPPTGADPVMKNTHIWVEWENCNNKSLFSSPSYDTTYIDNCLFSGYINNKTSETWNSAISPSKVLFTSCVFDLMANNGVGNAGTSGSGYSIFSASQTGRGNIFNTTKWGNAARSIPEFSITQEQMYSYSGLVSAGFPCARG